MRDEVVKKVQFSLPVPEGGDPRGQLSGARPSRPLDPRNFTDRTGARTRHIAQGPFDGGHPLTRPDALVRDSESLARRVRDSTAFDDRSRPGMSGAMLTGDHTETSSSMKEPAPNLHPLVRQILAELVASGQPMGVGHGRCAEVGTISNHLWEINPANSMSRPEVQAYFERTGAATVAHRPGIRITPACVSCAYLTKVLCIATLDS